MIVPSTTQDKKRSKRRIEEEEKKAIGEMTEDEERLNEHGMPDVVVTDTEGKRISQTKGPRPYQVSNLSRNSNINNSSTTKATTKTDIIRSKSP
jgi:hypothetical protein